MANSRSAARWLLTTACCGLLVLVVDVRAGGAELPDPETADPKDMPRLLIQMLGEGLRKTKRVDDYTATFYRMERVNDKIGDEERILLKFRERPFSVYMKWLSGDKKGREVVYIAGTNDNKMRLRLGPRELIVLPFRTVSLDPNHPTVLKHARHPITNAGFRNGLKAIKDICELALRQGDLGDGSVVSKGTRPFKDAPNDSGNRNVRETYVIERTLPQKDEYYCKRLVIYLDTKTYFPIRIVTYGFDEELLERYTYRDIRVNQGLTDADFDEKNEQYNF